MSAAVPGKDSSSEDESEESIRFNPRFSRHKNSIVSSSLPAFRIKPRKKSPSTTSDDLILEEDENPEPGLTPIPDLLRGVPLPEPRSKGSSLLSHKRTRVKSVHFKVPVWEQIPDSDEDNEYNPKRSLRRRPKKTKGVIKHFCASELIATQTELDFSPKYAQVTVLDDSLFTNSQILRWKLKWRRVRDKCIFLGMILIIILFLSPIVRFVIF